MKPSKQALSRLTQWGLLHRPAGEPHKQHSRRWREANNNPPRAPYAGETSPAQPERLPAAKNQRISDAMTKNRMMRRKVQLLTNGVAKQSLPFAKPSRFMLMHVTSVGYAKEILRSGQIEMRPCKVFGKKLLSYFFELRPAYRLKHNDEKQEHITMFPFVFIVSPDLLDTPYHVYPLDTGGADAGAFEAKADKHVPLEDYALSNSLDHAAGHITWLFGSPEDYYAGNVKANVMGTLQPFDSEARSCVAIAELASAGSNAPDDRASAIEVAYARHVKLREHARCVVVPKQFLESNGVENTEFLEMLRDANLEIRTYEWQPNVPPEFFRGEIRRIVRGYLVDQKILKP